MLQSLRENLKGSVAVVVVAIFVVPLVLFGVEQMFVGSVGGNDAAEVNGEGVSAIALQRELQLEKQRLAQQFDLPPNSPELEDERLREPVLNRLVQRLALVQTAQNAGMGASTDELWRQIAQVDAFRVDGRFDFELFRDRISGMYTPATYLEALGKDFVVSHLTTGIADSSFVTQSELAVIAAITQQQRDLFSIILPAVEQDSIDLAEAEIQQFYEQNQPRFTLPESVSVEYLELTLDALAADEQPSDAEVKAAYDEELRTFRAAPRETVAHILIEDGDDAQARIAEVQARLQQGAEFEDLAAEFSDDLGSKTMGGTLGLVVEEAYPKEFVSAARALDVDEVSPPVATEAGTHFIKLLERTNVSPPSLADRRDVITRQLSQAMAREKFILKVAELDELTFGQVDLSLVADRMNLTLQESSRFDRRGGTGIAAFDAVTQAAFSNEVLQQGYNSPVLELSEQRAVVLSVKEHQPEAVQPLAEVRGQIEADLRAEKAQAMLAERASELLNQLNAGQDPEALAAELELEYREHQGVDRTNTDADPSVLQHAFSLPRPGSVGAAVTDSLPLPAGGYAVVGVTAVTDGSVETLTEQQISSIRSQVARQMGQVELAAFERSVVEAADIRTR